QSVGRLEIADPGDAAEQEAQRATSAVLHARPFPLRSHTAGKIARQEAGGAVPEAKKHGAMVLRTAYRTLLQILNGYSMPTLLEAMAQLDRDGRLDALIDHVDEAAAYNQPRLVLAMDVVKLRYRHLPVTPAERRLLQERMGAMALPA